MVICEGTAVAPHVTESSQSTGPSNDILRVLCYENGPLPGLEYGTELPDICRRG
jgi:hypothetical protein